MRRRTRVWWSASLLATVLVTAVHVPAHSDTNLLPNGGFELGTVGWAAPVGATLAVDTSIPPVEGANAALLTSTGATAMSLASQYWQTTATPGQTYTLTASLRDNEAATSSALAKIEILDSVGTLLVPNSTPLAGADSAAFRPVTATVAAPAGAAYIRVTFTAQASAAGAHLSIDGVTVTAAPTVTPTPTPMPPSVVVEVAPSPPGPPEPPEEPPMPVVVPTARRTVTPSPTRTPTPTPTPTATPAPLPSASLRNPDFSQGLSGWTVTRGRISLASYVDGRGQSLLLTADDAATAWVQQTVAVTPGDWFSASALLFALDGTEATWVRIAWYATADGSGAQLSTDDSPSTSTADPTAFSRSGYEVVSTGPVQAPAEARSARVRILLRAATERGAAVVIDDVTFESTEPGEAAPPIPPTPPAPPPVAAARTLATPAPDSVPTPRVDVGTSSTNAPNVDIGERTPKPAAATAAQRRLRITEIMSNPADAGADGDFEWVEIMNTGTESANLAGVSLRDRRLGNVLPPYTLDPGAVVVIGAPGAHIADGAPLIRLRRAIGNGLGNTGDRVALVAADGREIDAVAYGEGIEDGEEPLLAPGPGQSIERRFSPAGILLESRLTDTPTPGQPPEARVRVASTSATAAATPDSFTMFGGLRPTWVVMLALAGGLVLGAGAARAAAVARRRA